MHMCIEGLADYIAGRYRKAAEIGIGRFPDVAYALLKRGIGVFATDIYPFVHDGLRVVEDDVTGPDVSLYADVDLIYSIRTPSELVPYIVKLAQVVHADLIVKPLSSEFLSVRPTRYGDTTFYVWEERRSNPS